MKTILCFFATFACCALAGAAEVTGLCSNPFLQIAANGKKVELTAEGKKNYKVRSMTEKDGAKVVTYETRVLSKEGAYYLVNGTVLDTIEFDKDGRAAKMVYRNIGHQGIHAKYVYGFDYEGGRCYTRTVADTDERMIADVRLCRELKIAIKGFQSCSENATKEISAIVSKYPNVYQRAVFRKNSSFGAAALAGAHIENCADDKALSQALSDETLWASAANGDSKSATVAQ